MRWERPFLALATANNAAWAVVLAVAPEAVCREVPPFGAAVPLLVLAVGACFAANLDRRRPLLLAAGTLAKVLGPAVFALAVRLGYLRASSWPLVLVTDVVWVLPLVLLLRRRASW